MLLKLRRDTRPADLESVLALCRELGYEVRTLGKAREVLELTGTGRPEHRSRFEDLAAVEQVLDSSDAPERTTRQRGPERLEDTCVHACEGAFGGPWISLVAGPCAVEDRDRLFEIAEAVRSSGATLLRGGAYKPRTSPYSFAGTGAPGLEALAEARQRTGLGIVTEVLDPRDVEAVWRVADVFQVGSRSMQNTPLLRELAKQEKPVLLKRGFAATVREFLLAAEFLLAGGNERVILCERGIRSFDSITRNVLDVGVIAHLKRETHLPVIADPSHAAGRSDLVRDLARAAVAAGADGLIVEVHTAPSEAHSDGAQAVSSEEFGRIAEDARSLAGLFGRRLKALRARGVAEARGREPVA